MVLSSKSNNLKLLASNLPRVTKNHAQANNFTPPHSSHPSCYIFYLNRKTKSVFYVENFSVYMRKPNSCPFSTIACMYACMIWKLYVYIFFSFHKSVWYWNTYIRTKKKIHVKNDYKHIWCLYEPTYMKFFEHTSIKIPQALHNISST